VAWPSLPAGEWNSALDPGALCPDIPGFHLHILETHRGLSPALDSLFPAIYHSMKGRYSMIS
jgi:hypothetical protein